MIASFATSPRRPCCSAAAATKELQKLVNRTGDGIVSARLDGQVILFNSAAESIFGAPA